MSPGWQPLSELVELACFASVELELVSRLPFGSSIGFTVCSIVMAFVL